MSIKQLSKNASWADDEMLWGRELNLNKGYRTRLSLKTRNLFDCKVIPTPVEQSGLEMAFTWTKQGLEKG